MTVSDTRSDEDLRRWLLDTAEEHGAAVIQIDGTEDAAPFAFTVGTWRRCGVPEAVVIGLPPEVAQAVLNTYVAKAGAGERFRPGELYDGFLEGCPVTFERVASQYYPEYFGHAFLVYRTGQFAAVQMVVSAPDGSWPWQEDAPGGFARWQPVLTDSGAPESWTPGVDGP